MTDKFFNPKISDTGWHKDLPAEKRRAKMLKAHRGNYLTAAKALQALSNVTRDKATSIAARADARYFYDMHEKTGR